MVGNTSGFATLWRQMQRRMWAHFHRTFQHTISQSNLRATKAGNERKRGNNSERVEQTRQMSDTPTLAVTFTDNQPYLLSHQHLPKGENIYRSTTTRDIYRQRAGERRVHGMRVKVGLFRSWDATAKKEQICQMKGCIGSTSLHVYVALLPWPSVLWPLGWVDGT